MKLTLMGSAAAIGWLMAVPFAFAQQPEAAAPAEPAHKVYVFTGCLEAGAEPANAFKLTDATPIAGVSASKSETAIGTSGRKVEYVLQPVSGMTQSGVDEAGLKKHVGQRVEVTLRPVDLAPAAPPSVTSPAVVAVAPIEPAPERYSVTAIKTARGSCPAS